jgi:hypothetical protein
LPKRGSGFGNSPVCVVRGTVFEYTAQAGQPPKFIVYHGTVEMTADGKRLSGSGESVEEILRKINEQ